MQIDVMNGLSRMNPVAMEAMQGLSRLEQDTLMNGLRLMDSGEVLGYAESEEMGRLFDKLRQRIQDKRDQRREFKLEKIRTRAAGRAGVAEAGGGVGGLFRGLGEGLKGVFGRGAPPPGMEEGLLPYPSPPPPPPPKIFGLTYPQAGLAAAGVGALIWFGTRKKKK